MEAIRYYVQGAFQGVKLTPEVLEQQEELIADLTAKVGDLVAQGKPEEEALGVAIASLGDLSALISEFESAVETPDRIPTTSVYATHLDLHVVAVSASVGAAVMIASTALGAWTELVHPGAGFSLLGVLAVGIWWIRGAYLRYQEVPDAVEIREITYKARFRKALLVWAGIAFGATLLNAMIGTDFWCWPIWVAGGTWALTVKVEERLVERPEFHAPSPTESETA
ncbi:MAG: permease prefix domain 1-containing protein [Coriobacteriia bacterium]|nr:permease prefix domain 1-containing protein [Coriobacteriia bacterium]